MSLADRYRALPRAARWLVWLVAIVVAYLLVVVPALDVTERYERSADSTARDLARERSLRADAIDPNNPGAAARALFGAPALPAPADARSQALYARVNRILDAHRLRADITESPRTSLGGIADTLAASVAPGGEQIDRISLGLAFEADPEAATAVLAELENAPEVASITKLSVRRADAGRANGSRAPRRLRVNLTLEAWGLAPRRTSGRGA